MKGLYTRSPTPHTRPLDAETIVDDPVNNPAPGPDEDDPMRFVRLPVESPAESPAEASVLRPPMAPMAGALRPDEDADDGEAKGDIDGA